VQVNQQGKLSMPRALNSLELHAKSRRLHLALASILAAACTLLLTAAPAFAATKTLQVTVHGEGEVTASAGTVFGCTEAGGPSCEGEYEEGEVLHLTAEPFEGKRFIGWSTIEGDHGTCTGATTHCEVTVTQATKLKALFSNQSLKVTVTDPGNRAYAEAQVSADEGEISGCEESDSSSCEGQYFEGATVTLTAYHSERTAFLGWEGCTTENGLECQVEVGASPAEVKARFEAIPQLTLSLDDPGSGRGSGVVTVAPPGPEFLSLECGGGALFCSAEYNENAEITLTATPAPHSKFLGWSGGGAGQCFQNPICTITMDADKEVKAYFAPSSFMLTAFLTGQGTVESAPAGLACSSEECGAEFATDAEVTLTATPASGYVFAGWLGCKHTGPATCEVKMTSEEEVTAVFLKEGPQGNPGSQGPQGEEGQQGKEGKEGQQGKEGKEGPAGQVTCQVKQKGKKVKVTCTVSQSPKRHNLRWSLRRGDRLYAHGEAVAPRFQLDLGRLRPGRYLLHVQGQGRGAAIVVG
jgi:Divergent InlB B-repeat domain/Collagen triple helix repeat (20 copies)